MDSQLLSKIGEVKIGIIGGTGLYSIEGITNVKEIEVKTPFGAPSDKIVIGELEGVRCAFLPRHGRGHTILPTEINSLANIYALKMLGVEQIIAISACGSLKEEIRPRDVVLPDQFFDRTKFRRQSFFTDGIGIAAHVSFAQPVCMDMVKIIYQVLKSMSLRVHLGGTYVCIEGPQFSTKAESQVNRILGFSVVGMTALPEARLAREAEICYATVAAVTDYDVWKEGEEVTIGMVVENLNANIENMKKMIKEVLPKLASRERNCECKDALKYAIFSKDWKKNKKAIDKLGIIVRRYL